MPFKCPCCPKSKTKAIGSDSIMQRVADDKIDANRRERTAKILKNEVYEGIMKKYFETGQDYKAFSELFMGENAVKVRV